MADAVKTPAKKRGKAAKAETDLSLLPPQEEEGLEDGKKKRFSFGKKSKKGKEAAEQEETLEPKAEKKAKKAKKEKAPKAPKAAKKPRAKKGQGSLLLLTVLVVLLVVAGVFLYLTIVNDWGGVRTSLLTTVNRLDPNFRHLEEQKIIEYNAAKAQLESDQARLLQDQQALDRRKAELDSRQVAISQAETDMAPLYRRNLSEDKLAEIKKTGEMYEKMDPQVAAGIMSRLYDESYMAAVLYYMKPQNGADVMSFLPADLAARVTMELLKD